MNLHGTVIHFKDINNLVPNRNKFLDKTLSKKIKKIKNNDKTLLFMPNSTWDDKHMQSSSYDKSRYKLVLFGILEDGARATVIIDDIEPYFEVKIPDKEKNPEAFAQKLYEDLFMCDDNFTNFKAVTNSSRSLPKFGFKIEPIRKEIVIGKPLHNFQIHNSNYVKIYFNKLSHRKDAIAFVRGSGYETAHDDASCYYRVVSRDYFLQLGTWINLDNYIIKPSKYIKGDVIYISINDIINYTGEITKHLLKDNTMTMAFDIETYNKNNDGEIPMPENSSHNMFMISMTFQWYHASDQLLQVCLVDVPSAAHPDFLTIVCDTEKNLILGFAQIFAKMQPELVMGFNSDNYDWPWIVERAHVYPGVLAHVVELIDMSIQEDHTDAKALFNYKKSCIKIEATLSADGQNLQAPGFIPFDVMTVFRKLYPTSEQYSLNFFLSKNKLGGKEDMPYMEMFKIYADTVALVNAGLPVTDILLDKMALVAKYCVVDSARCHDLTNIRNVLPDKRAVANISYTSVYDAFYRADGMKVRNLVISRAQLRNLKISNIPTENISEGKYPGAWVFPPVKGLSVSKLSITERIEKANLGYTEYAEWLTVTPQEISEYKEHIAEHGPATATKTHVRECFKKMLSEHMGRPITGLDYSSLYPSLMMAYNLSPEYMITALAKAKAVNKLTNPDGTKVHDLYKIKFDYNNDVVRGWSVRHDNKLDPTQPDFKFGIFPTILKELFDARKQLKSGPLGLIHWEHEKEKLMALPIEEFESSDIKEKFSDVCFNYNALDSKQRALKVFMNTFYGESGNKRSPLFMIQVAGGITMAGRDNIKRAYDYVKENNCSVYYGDSVTPDTPILIRYTDGPLAGSIDIRTIDDIPFEITDGYSESSNSSNESDIEWSTKWYGYPQFKPNDKGLVNKEYHYPVEGLETWTHLGWKPIKKIIRHKTNKKIIRINTFKGLVDVTEDHSLLTDKLEKISPKNAKVGDKLFHSFPTEFPSEPKFEEIIVDESNEILLCARCKEIKPLYEFYSHGNKNGKWCRKCTWIQNQKRTGISTDMKEYFSETEYLLNVGKNLTEDEAWVWGAGHADGCFKNYKYKGENNNTWCINKLDLNHLNIILEKLKKVEPFFQFKIILKKSSQTTHKIQAYGRLGTLVKKYTNLLYDKRDYKIVPACILNAPINIRRAYFEGFTAGDGWKNDKGIINFCQKGKINAQGLYYLMRSIGYNDINVLTQEYKPDIYWIYTVENKSPPEIRKIFDVNNIMKESYESKQESLKEQLEALNIDTDNNMEYVYDIETEAGTFQAGVGNLVVKNTDSLYLSTPDENFKQTDIDYYTEKISKLEYWTKLIEITFTAIKPLAVEVNNMLEENNGTKFLKMAYEESLFPVAFLAKKKYFGIPHISQPNFNENVQLFIRGLELKKRGVSEVLINVCNDILNRAVSYKNILTIMEIVQNKIVEFYNTDWSTPEKFPAFIMTGVYKPNKQNVKMHTFKRRMAEERGIEIAPGERIKYVIVKKYPYSIDLRGRKTALSIGDTMELADKASEENIPVNIDYYMDKTINGQLARFITYHEDFQVAHDPDDPEELKKAELTNLKLARKFIDNYCQKYYTNYANKSGIYKTIFAKSALVVKNKMIEVCGEDKSANVIIKLLGFSVDPEDDLEKWIQCKIQTDVEKKPKNKMFGENFINDLLSTESLAKNNVTKSEYILILQDTYYANKLDNILKISETYYHDRQQILEIRFRQSINLIKSLYHSNNNVIKVVSDHIKSIIDIDNKYNDSVDENGVVLEKDLDLYLEPAGVDVNKLNDTLDNIATENINYILIRKGINELKFIYYNLICNYEYIYHVRSIVLCLKAYRNKKINYIKPVDGVLKKKMIESFINDAVAESMQSYS
jgi:DNA polymerase elongation subunit (family B)